MIEGYGDYQVFFVGDYGKKVKALRLWKFFFYLAFVVLSFMLSFIELKYNFTKIMAGVYNLISVIVFFYDTFIKSIKKDKYILILQRHTEKEMKISDLFEIQNNKAQYDLTGNDETMVFKLVEAEQGTAICRKCKDGSLLLVPNENLEPDELQFICKQINIYWTYHSMLPKTVICFEDKAIYKHINEYVWELFPKIDFLFLPQTKKKAINLVKILGGGAFTAVLVLLFLYEFFELNLFAPLLNWLFE